jgi:hypothetical protein
MTSYRFRDTEDGECIRLVIADDVPRSRDGLRALLATVRLTDEATRLIKSKWPEVKVIVLSLYSAYQAQALAAGADVFLIKGCPAEQLLEAVLECWKET